MTLESSLKKIEDWDIKLFLRFYKSDFSRKTKKIAKVLSFFGSYYVWAIIWLSLALYGFFTKEYYIFELFNGGWLQSLSIFLLIRYKLVNRNRPFISLEEQGVKQEDSYIAESKSFPSGHVTFFIFFGYVFAFYFQNWWILFAFLIVGGVMAVTRLFLGVHFPLDVIFGFIFGNLFALLYLGLTYSYWIIFQEWVGDLWLFSWFFDFEIPFF